MRSRGGTAPGRRSRSVPGLNVIASRSAYDDAPDLSEGLTAASVEGYFGRFEAFFLPAAQWEQVREAFWARTGFPVDPDAAIERLKVRLSDAFDRFLEGVADNRQVTFEDDGWRLKTDAAEQPDPGAIGEPR